MRSLLFSPRSAILLIVVAFAVSSCSSMMGRVPQAPNLTIYLHDEPSRLALCAQSTGDKCSALDISKTDKYFMISPKMWGSINDYIDALVYEIEKPESSPIEFYSNKYQVMSNAKKESVKELRKYQYIINNLLFNR